MLAALSSLNVSGCQFTGLLPPEINNISDLVELYVDNNNLSGPISSGKSERESIEGSFIQFE
jgi:hypothetical protein